MSAPGILRPLRSESLLAFAFAAARTGFCLYRASTQSLVHDEAFSFDRFVDGPWSRLWSLYDASNHVLYSALAKLSIASFGLSELTLRLPSVFAGFVLMVGTFRLLSSCRSRLLRWVVYLALGLHPLLLDFSVAARGYGLALALLLFAIDAAMRDRPILSGSLAGLAISANLTVAAPTTGLILARFLQMRGPWRARIRVAGKIALPALATAVLICYFPLRTAKPLHFYAGLDRLGDSVLNLTAVSITASARTGLFGSAAAARFLAWVAVPLIVVASAVAAVLLWRTNRGDRRLTTPLTLGISVALLLAGHLLLGVRYPIDRTGLYLIHLAGINAAFFADAVGGRIARGAGILLAALLLVQFGTLLQTRQFAVWWYDAAVKDVALRLQQECRAKPDASLSVSVTPLHEPALEFYRKYYRISALKPVVRRDEAIFTGQDYYVFNRVDQRAPQSGPFQVLFSDPDSGIILAK